MRYLRLIGVAFVTVCALSTVIAVSAFALPTILPETAQTWTDESTGEATMVKANGETVKCTKTTGEGTVEAGIPLGLYHLRLRECSTEVGKTKVTCTGEGAESGVILELGSYHLVYDTLSVNLTADGVAILWLVATVKFTCSIVKIEVKLGGMVLCLILNPTALTKEFEFHCNKAASGNRPAETKYYNAAGTLVGITPQLVSQNGGATEELTNTRLELAIWQLAQLIMI